MLNRAGPNSDPWGALLETDFQVDVMPLVTTLRDPLSLHCSVQITIYSLS